MTNRNQSRWVVVALLSFLTCCALEAQDVMLVANKSVGISQIKTSDLRAIFTGEKTRFSDGQHAIPVTLKGGPAHEVFVRNYCDEAPEEFRAQWRKVTFTGQGAMPRAFDSESALIAYVADTPGAVGYASRISSTDNVKLLTALK